MNTLRGLQTCDCCKGFYNQEFQKIVELQDVGVTLYRYLPQTQDERQKVNETGEVFVLRNTGEENVKLEELIMELGRTKISCPRCIKMMIHAQKLYKNVPKLAMREITSICDHCYLRQRLHCPCCEQIFDKFLMFCKDEAKQKEERRQRIKTWLKKTEMVLKKTLLNVQDGKLRPRALSEGRIPYKKVTITGGTQQTIRSIPTDNDFEPAAFLRIPKDTILEGDDKRLKNEQSGEEMMENYSLLDFFEEPVNLEPKIKRMGILKFHEGDGRPGTSIASHWKRKRPVSPTKKYSFENIIKSASEADVSIFSYTFPDNKIVTKTQIENRISSSELIKKTQEMIQERAEADKKKHGEEIIKKRETGSLKTDEKEDTFLPEHDKWKSMAKSPLLSSKVEKLSEKAKGPEQKTISEKQQEKVTLSEKAKGPEQKMLLEKQQEKVTTSSVKKGGLDKRAEKKPKELKKTENKIKTEMKHDAVATSDVNEQITKQAKNALTEDKIRKQQDKDRILGGKKNKKAEKSIEAKQQQSPAELKKGETILEKSKEPEQKENVEKQQTSGKKESLEERPGKKLKEVKKPELQRDAVAPTTSRPEKDKEPEQKAQIEKQNALAATTDLKEQIAKHNKEALEEAKIKKVQEKLREIEERKAKDASKKLEEATKKLEEGAKETTTDKKTLKTPQVKVESSKERLKNEKLLEKAKEQERKAKEAEEKKHNLAAVNILKENMAEIKREELEAERNRKEQEREREAIEKKSREAEAKVTLHIELPKFPIVQQPVGQSKSVFTFGDISDEIANEPENVITDVIIGEEICDITDERYQDDKLNLESIQSENPSEQKPDHKPAIMPVARQVDEPKLPSSSDAETPRGVIRYALSDSTFIDKGWTMLPTEKIVRKMNVYRMRPAKPEFDWFEHNKLKREMKYDTGEKLAEIDDNGRGRWYYRNGKLALDYYDAEETNAGQRFVVYSNDLPDERGRSRPRTILATFDYLGNGVVFDHAGKIRLKYNQTEGVVLDRRIGPVSHWKWHTLNDPPVLQQVMIDTQMPYKDPRILKLGDKNADMKRPDNDDMLAIEFQNFLREKSQKLSQTFKPFQIRMKAMKINENFSLRVLDQASVYLLFRDGTTNLKINIGMVLDHKEIVDTDTAEIGEVMNSLDKLPAGTDSVAGLQRAVSRARALERSRVRHEGRLKRPSATASADELRAGCSRALRVPVAAGSNCACSQTSVTHPQNKISSRFKPSCCNLYYNTQLY